MHLEHLAILASLLGLTQAKPVPIPAPAAQVTSTSTTKSLTTSCTYVTSTSAPTGITCGTSGILSSLFIPVLSTTTRYTLAGCQSACRADAKCTSFGLDSTANLCTLYSKSLQDLGFLPSLVAPVTFYDAGCFVKACSTFTLKSSTTVKSTTKSTNAITVSLPTLSTSLTIILGLPMDNATSSSLSATSVVTATITPSASASSTSSSIVSFSFFTNSSTSTTSTSTTTTTSTSTTSTAACSPVPPIFRISVLNSTTPTYLTPLSFYAPLQPLTTTNSLTLAGIFSLSPSPNGGVGNTLNFTLPDGTSRVLYSEQDVTGQGNEDIYFEQGYSMERYGDVGITWDVDPVDCTLDVGVQGAPVGGYVVQVCANGGYAGGVEVALRTVVNAAQVDPSLGCEVVLLGVVPVSA